MATTLLLDRSLWDLLLDSSGNIALAREPYAIAQDVASACRTFLGEVYYDATLGVPYFQQILNHRPPLALLKAQMVAAALTVPGCTNPVCIITGIAARKVSGQVRFTDASGNQQTAAF